MLSYLVDGSQQNIIYSEQNIASKILNIQFLVCLVIVSSLAIPIF